MTRIRISYGTGESVPFEIAGQETREAILNKLHYNGAMTVNQLSETMGMAQSVIHGQVKTLEEHDLIKEVKAPEKRKSRVERYYDLNVPVMSIGDQERIQKIGEEFAEKLVETAKEYFDGIPEREGFDFTDQGWSLDDPDIRQYIFNQLSRSLLDMLQKNGVLETLPQRKGEWRGYLWGMEYQEERPQDPTQK